MYSRSAGEVNSNRVTSSLLRKRPRLPTHAHEVRALTLEVTDNFGSNVVLPCGAYGPWWLKRPPRDKQIRGSIPAVAEGIFPGSSPTSDLKLGIPVATLPGARRYRVSAETGWPGGSIL